MVMSMLATSAGCKVAMLHFHEYMFHPMKYTFSCAKISNQDKDYRIQCLHHVFIM